MASIARAKAMAAAAARAKETEQKSETSTEDDDDAGLVLPRPMLEQKWALHQPTKPPAVPLTPAPRANPPHSVDIPFSLLHPLVHQTPFGRAMNSTVGRLSMFVGTLLLFFICCLCVVSVQDRETQLNGEHIPLLFFTLVALMSLFAGMPYLSEQAGMHARSTGWKPYMVFYRMAFATSVPALFFLSLGWGGQAAHGLPASKSEADLSVGQLQSSLSGKYFEAVDGFVALNLTKGITEIALRSTHGGNHLRISRYRDAELLINREPFTGLTEPTVPPGRQKLYVLAPIFRTWSPCVSRYQISSVCLNSQVIVGWAYSSSTSMCESFGAMNCRAGDMTLDPVYKCATEAIHGNKYVLPVGGLCGRVSMPPQDDVIDELSGLLKSDGWPLANMPNASMPWIDVTPEECMGRVEECTAYWNQMGSLGTLFVLLTALFILIPAYMDQRIDANIREVQSYIQEKQGASPAPFT